MLNTDILSLLSTMELRYQQAIKSNAPFSVLKKHYAELKQVRELAAHKTVLTVASTNS